jgi:predicted XRE-type DNA-binding protein
MENDPIELIPGSGNLFCDFGQAHADVAQLKAILAAEIIKILDEQDLSVRKAHAQTGFAAADFSRIRNADLGRFTVDRLMTILNSLGWRVEVSVQVKHRETASAPHI